MCILLILLIVFSIIISDVDVVLFNNHRATVVYAGLFGQYYIIT